jgi:SnoaL-like protein
MSQKNVEIVRRLWEAWERRDTEAVLGLYDPDIVWEVGEGPLGDPTGGHEGVRVRVSLAREDRRDATPCRKRVLLVQPGRPLGVGAHYCFALGLLARQRQVVSATCSVSLVAAAAGGCASNGDGPRTLSPERSAAAL